MSLPWAEWFQMLMNICDTVDNIHAVILLGCESVREKRGIFNSRSPVIDTGRLHCCQRLCW